MTASLPAPPLPSPPTRDQPTLLVALDGCGEQVSTVDCAAALAQALGASWHALFVETPRSVRNPKLAERAGEALAQAARLGATVSRETAANLSVGLLDHLQTASTDHLVIAPPLESRWRTRFGGSMLHDLPAHCPDLVIHLAPGRTGGRRPILPLPSVAGASPRDYLVGLGLVAITVVLCEGLRLVTGGRPLSLLFLFPVIAVAARSGVGPALAASLLSVLGFDFFLLPPRLHFEPLAPVNLILGVALVAVAIYTSVITGALRSRLKLSDRSAHESARIVSFAQTLTRVSTWSETAQAVCDEFAAVMEAQVLLFREKDGELVRVGATPPDAALGAIDRAALDWSWTHGEKAGAGTTTIAAADWRFEPLQTSLGRLAVLALSRNDGRDPIRADREILFATLASQAALAHERLVLEDRARSTHG